MSSRMRNPLILRNRKLVVAALALVADSVSFLIVMYMIPNLNHPAGPVSCTVVNCNQIGPQLPPQPLFYPVFGLGIVMAIAAPLLLVYILTLLAKKTPAATSFQA